MYGLIHSGGEGQNGQRTTLVRIDARPSDECWHVMRVKDNGANRCKHGLTVHSREVVWQWDELPTSAQRRHALRQINSAREGE